MDEVYTAMLLGRARVGTGEPVLMQMPASGKPPENLERRRQEGDVEYIDVYDRMGDPDGLVYVYVYVYVYVHTLTTPAE